MVIVMVGARSGSRGATMIEVLVAIVVFALGLLGLAGLQTRLQVSEIESYQRSQALILMQDMANRLTSNRAGAADYVTGADAPIGAPDADCSEAADASRQALDARDWCLALQGASETSAGGASVGAMLGARGCIESIGADTYLITVTWQGMAPLSVPPQGVDCASGEYDTAGTACTGDVCRRFVTTVVNFGALM